MSSTERSVTFAAAGVLAVVGTMVLLAGALLFAAPALAAGAPPRFTEYALKKEVFPTRVRIEPQLAPQGLETNWRSEYSTKKEGPFTVSDSGVLPATSEIQGTFIGSEEAASYGAETHFLRHLKPETLYYIHFTAENPASDGTPTVDTFEVITPPVARPEIVHQNQNGRPLFESAAPDSPTARGVQAVVETNGAETSYEFAYSQHESGPWTQFTNGATGSISVAEDIGFPSAHTTGLTPETQYYFLLTAKNSAGKAEEILPVKTLTVKPRVSETRVHNVTGTSVHLTSEVEPQGSKTEWRFEYAPSAIGPWTPVPGASGTISQAEAEAIGSEEGTDGVGVAGDLVGLDPSTPYYVRLFAENNFGEGQNYGGEPIMTGRFITQMFETEGPPTASTFAVHAFHGEALRLLGSVDPNDVPLPDDIQTVTVGGSPTGGTFTLTFEKQTTVAIAFDATQHEVAGALQKLAAVSLVGGVEVSGPDGGPYTLEFITEDGAKVPAVQADSSGLLPSGTVSVVVVQESGGGYDTHYHFQYVDQHDFEGGGSFSDPAVVNTPEVDLGTGKAGHEGVSEPAVVGSDLPALSPGETYRFRIVATSTFPGNPTVYGEERSLTVPVVSGSAGEGPCANEALRAGPSARLPDCRAYEQVTPVEKNGAEELLQYGSEISEGALVAEDGNSVVFSAPLTHWGSGPTSGESPYFFDRTANGWQTVPAAAQPEAGIDLYYPQVFSPDLSAVGLSSQWNTSAQSKSATNEYKVGPPGGPYTVVTVPRSATAGEAVGEGWDAASEDFSKLILAVEYHDLTGPTHTKSGQDLYEVADGELRQLNVGSDGTTIGTCGANIVKGLESPESAVSSRHAVSANGSRVFFEAVPGNTCSATKELYMRVNGAETVDIGVYRFLAADATGTTVLLANPAGDVYSYDAETASLKRLVYGGSEPHPLVLGVESSRGIVISEDVNAIYLAAGKLIPEAPALGEEMVDLYRYDVASETLRFVAQVSGQEESSTNPDGNYFYFDSQGVGGVPAAGPERKDNAEQVFRYDAEEDLIQCVSCASPFDPEPRLNANLPGTYVGGGVDHVEQGMPRSTGASANGDYVFFQTPAALLPEDVDGEVTPEGNVSSSEHGSPNISLSSDVYEWRKPGVGGCSHLQGCLNLISGGKGGFYTVLLGTDQSGSNVFFFTKESLVRSDDDTSGDIYDARIGGGFPEATHPVECEGDSCSTPFAPPGEVAPSSSTFHGAGDVFGATSPQTTTASKPKKAKTKKKKIKRKKRKRDSAKAKGIDRRRGGWGVSDHA